MQTCCDDDPAAADTEMNNGEEEEDDTGSDDKTQEDEDSDDRVNEVDRQPRLFAIRMVNSYGSAEVNSIRDDGKPIRFHNRPYVAIDWHPRAKQLFYDEKAAEVCVTLLLRYQVVDLMVASP